MRVSPSIIRPSQEPGWASTRLFAAILARPGVSDGQFWARRASRDRNGAQRPGARAHPAPSRLNDAAFFSRSARSRSRASGRGRLETGGGRLEPIHCLRSERRRPLPRLRVILALSQERQMTMSVGDCILIRAHPSHPWFSPMAPSPSRPGKSLVRFFPLSLALLTGACWLLRVNRTAVRCGLAGKNTVSRGRCSRWLAGGACKPGGVAASKLALVLSR